MMQVIYQSALWRCFSALKKWYEQSAVNRFFSSITVHYHSSVSKKIWERFLTRPDFVAQSWWASFMDFLRNGAILLGVFFKNSLAFRCATAVNRWFWNVFGKSAFFGALRKIGVRGLLIAAFALYLPIDYALRLIPKIGFLASVWDEMLIAFAALYIFVRRGLKKTDAVKRETPVDVYILLFMAAGFFLMCVVAPNPSIALDGYRAVVEYMVWYFLLIRLIENDRDFRIFYITFLTMAVLMSLHGIYQYIIDVPIPESWVSQTEMGVRTRVFSLANSPNIFGSFLVMTAPMAAALMYYLKPLWQKVLAAGVTGIMCLCLLFTFSRGAWVGIVVAVIIFALCIDRRLLALLAAGAAGALALVPSIADRITYLFTSDYAEASLKGGRAVRWATGKLLLSESNPFLGFGLGRFGGAVAMQNKVIEETDDFKYFYMDNYYLKTAVEMGYLGLFFYLLMLLALLVYMMRACFRIRSDKTFILACAMFAGICGVLAHCYFENIFEVPYMMAYFWGMAACIAYLGFFRKRAG